MNGHTSHIAIITTRVSASLPPSPPPCTFVLPSKRTKNIHTTPHYTTQQTPASKKHVRTQPRRNRFNLSPSPSSYYRRGYTTPSSTYLHAATMRNRFIHHQARSSYYRRGFGRTPTSWRMLEMDGATSDALRGSAIAASMRAGYTCLNSKAGHCGALRGDRPGGGG